MRRTKWYTQGRKWDLALVKEVCPGVDGVVRNGLVKAKSGVQAMRAAVLYHHGSEVNPLLP